MSQPHKYDQGAYTVLFFDQKGRKAGEALSPTLAEADEIGDDHEAKNGGSYVVVRTIKNSAESSSWMPKK